MPLPKTIILLLSFLITAPQIAGVAMQQRATVSVAPKGTKILTPLSVAIISWLAFKFFHHPASYYGYEMLKFYAPKFGLKKARPATPSVHCFVIESTGDSTLRVVSYSTHGWLDRKLSRSSLSQNKGIPFQGVGKSTLLIPNTDHTRLNDILQKTDAARSPEERAELGGYRFWVRHAYASLKHNRKLSLLPKTARDFALPVLLHYCMNFAEDITCMHLYQLMTARNKSSGFTTRQAYFFLLVYYQLYKMKWLYSDKAFAWLVQDRITNAIDQETLKTAKSSLEIQAGIYLLQQQWWRPKEQKRQFVPRFQRALSRSKELEATEPLNAASYAQLPMRWVSPE